METIRVVCRANFENFSLTSFAIFDILVIFANFVTFVGSPSLVCLKQLLIFHAGLLVLVFSLSLKSMAVINESDSSAASHSRYRICCVINGSDSVHLKSVSVICARRASGEHWKT